MKTRTKIIISIVAVIVIAAGVVDTLYLIKNSGQEPDQATDAPLRPGQNVSLEKTPDFESCSVVTSTVVTPILNPLDGLSEGKASGVVAHNYEPAERCQFTYDTSKSSDNTLSIEVYFRTADPDKQETENFDSSWRNISKVFYPEDYTLTYPAFFKSSIEGDKKVFQFQLNTGARNYRFVLEQPVGEGLSDEEGQKALLQIASKANYDTGQLDAPPAPEV